MSHFDYKATLNSAVKNLWPQRHSPYCRYLLKSAITDLRVLFPKECNYE